MAIALDFCLSEMIEASGSDLLLASGYPPAVRVYGRLTPLDMPLVESEDVDEILKDALTPLEYSRFQEECGLDFAYESMIGEHGINRFRCNAYVQSRGFSVVFRIIPWVPPSMSDLGLPEQLASLTTSRNGLVLVTGPAGCGKTSTLAAMCRYINDTRAVHMVMIEDPIEYVHRNNRAMIVQRQVGVHVSSFQRALKAVLREDPDVIVIGELRDLETIQLAITAAETGHLVLGTMHTTSAMHTVSRIISAFPASQQWQVRTMLADSFKASISQQLLQRADGQGVIPAVELLINTEAVANLIREDKCHQIPGVMESSASRGMRLMDQELLRLVRDGSITADEAMAHGHDKRELAARLDTLRRRGSLR